MQSTVEKILDLAKTSLSGAMESLPESERNLLRDIATDYVRLHAEAMTGKDVSAAMEITDASLANAEAGLQLKLQRAVMESWVAALRVLAEAG